MNEEANLENNQTEKAPRPILQYSKNVDFDAFYVEQENTDLAATRIKTKSMHRPPPDPAIPIMKKKSSNQLHRDTEILQDLVITKFKAETLESYLNAYNIQPSRLGKISGFIGKVVYSFKIYNIRTLFSWTIRKTITEFDKLFKSFKAFLKQKGSRSELGKAKSIDIVDKEGKKIQLTFDYIYCKKIEEANPNEILGYLDLFLNNMSDIPEIVNFLDFFDFIEFSCIVYPVSAKKFKECYLKKKPGGRYRETFGAVLCKILFPRWTKRWFLISEDGIKYCMGPGKDKCVIREMLLFDNSLKIEYGFKQTGSPFGLKVTTTSRKLVLKTASLWDLYDLIGAMEDAIKSCTYIQENRFASFAPQRQKPLSYCKYYVDGENYYSDLCDSLLQAQGEVFITDWWLSPELYLKRPVNDDGLNQDSRLDRVLGTIAKKGVKVYIIVYREVSFVLPLDSNHTKSHLEKLNSNIKVLQHPPDLICWWSHHEKLVIIDQELAFLGGLDLCFGRMDNNHHKLIDLEGEKGQFFWPGIDYSNCRIADFREVKKHEKPLITRDTPRMPWHDIAVQVLGVPVKDLARHFIQYWNYAKIDLADRKMHLNKYKRTRAKLSISPGTLLKSSKNKVLELDNIICEMSAKRKSKQRLSVIEDNGDWNNDYDELKLPFDLHSKRYTHNSQMPKESELYQLKKTVSASPELIPTISRESGSAESRRSIKKSFTEKRGDYSPSKSSLLKLKKTQTLKAPSAIKENFMELYSSMNKKKETFIDYEHNIEGYKEATKRISKKKMLTSVRDKVQINDHFYEENMLLLKYEESSAFRKRYLQQSLNFSCKCQIVRSASNWSCGLDSNRYENSIQFAYLELIEESEHYIYIENQFFISGLAGSSVENNIAKALLYRIKQAHVKKELFKVIVVMPLLPGFEGDIADKASAVMRIQLHWEYSTISRSENSLITSLEKEGINPNDYLIFLGLRNHAKHKKPLTEIVYVHSKLMIVDDRVVILGSANINDRSMNGNRDSEIGIVIEDTVMVETEMDNDRNFRASKSALDLRLEIWEELFGFERHEMMNPVGGSFWTALKTRAKKNTEIYRKVFACYPDNCVTKLSDLEKFYKTAQPELYDLLKSEIKGFVVEFPHNFLIDENLKFNQYQREYYAPEYNFT